MEKGSAATRLRQARLDAGLALSDIERRTRISPTMLRWIDEGHFHRLPAGIYARAYVRAFAEAVGAGSGRSRFQPRARVAAGGRGGYHPGSDPGSDSRVRLREQGDRRGEAERRGSRAPRPRRVDRRWLWMAAASTDAVILVTVCAIVVAATAAVCGAPRGRDRRARPSRTPRAAGCVHQPLLRDLRGRAGPHAGRARLRAPAARDANALSTSNWWRGAPCGRS